MKFTKALGSVALGLGSVAAAARGLRYDEELEPALAGEQDTYRWRGMDVAYAEGGDPDDPDIVLLHGINAAGSSGEWREVFGDLTADYHVIAPDLPGFGCSDRPPLRYSAALYEDFVHDFLQSFDAPTVVASSLSAAYAARATEHSNVDVSRFVLICPTTKAGPEPPKGPARELLRAPVVGEGIFRLLTSKPAIRYFNADHGYYQADAVDAEWTDYEWRTTHVEGARFAFASFISGFLNSDIDIGAILADLDVPTTIVWGRETAISPLADGRELANEAGAELVVFDRAKLLPHVEYPNKFLDVLRNSETAD